MMPFFNLGVPSDFLICIFFPNLFSNALIICFILLDFIIALGNINLPLQRLYSFSHLRASQRNQVLSTQAEKLGSDRLARGHLSAIVDREENICHSLIIDCPSWSSDWCLSDHRWALLTFRSSSIPPTTS